MERMVYYVSPTSDQLDWDEDGPVDRSLFVWATDASEAIKLWRAYYEENRPAAIRKSGGRWWTLADVGERFSLSLQGWQSMLMGDSMQRRCKVDFLRLVSLRDGTLSACSRPS
jgi:hypothetical protein